MKKTSNKKNIYSDAEARVCGEVALELDRIMNRIECIGGRLQPSKEEELYALLSRLHVIANTVQSSS